MRPDFKNMGSVGWKLIEACEPCIFWNWLCVGNNKFSSFFCYLKDRAKHSYRAVLFVAQMLLMKECTQDLCRFKSLQEAEPTVGSETWASPFFPIPANLYTQFPALEADSLVNGAQNPQPISPRGAVHFGTHHSKK